MTDKLESLVNRLEAAVGKLESLRSGGGGGGGDSEENLYLDFLNQYFTPLTAAAAKLPESFQNYVKLFRAVFDEVNVILQNTRRSKKPSDQDLAKIIAPYKKSIQDFLKFGVKVPLDYKNHCKAMEEAVKGNNWIISSSPVNEIHNMWDIGDYHALKVKSPPEDVTYIKALRALMVNLEQFVKDNYKMGISWNPNGGDALSFTPGASSAPAPAPAAAAPSPPPSAAPAKPVVNLAAALAQGQDGASCSSAFGLKHVKDEDKTKNRPAEEKKFTVPSEIGPKAVPKAAAAAGPAKTLPPVFNKVGAKLSVENYVNDKKLKYEAEADGKDVIYLYNNKNVVLTLINKVNSITIDKSTNTALIVDNVISSIEIVNSKNITIQLNGVAASVVVDSTDEVKIYLTDKGAEKLEVFSSKSGNIVLYKPEKKIDPDTNQEYEGHVELAVPGTVRSVIVKNELNNTFVKHG